MDSSEKAALQEFARDLFTARADLHHERECIDNACARLRDAMRELGVATSETDKVNRLCRIIDDADVLLRARRTP